MEETAKQNLETLLKQSSESPGILISPKEIIGNRAGYLSLALAALEASRGNSIDLRKQDWSTFDDWGYTIGELKYDEKPEFLEPPKPSWLSGAFGQWLGRGLFLVFLIVLALGLFETVHIVHLLILMK